MSASRLSKAKEFITSACSISVLIAKDVLSRYSD